MSETGTRDFKPSVLVFCCNWCAYAGADLAGVSRFKITPHFRIIRTMCSGRVDPELILEAFANGADGVMVAGCHPGDCHYMEGNYKTMRRMVFLKKMVEDLGLEPDRLALEWVSAGEGGRFREVINAFVDRIIELGPGPFGKKAASAPGKSERVQAEA